MGDYAFTGRTSSPGDRVLAGLDLTETQEVSERRTRAKKSPDSGGNRGKDGDVPPSSGPYTTRRRCPNHILVDGIDHKTNENHLQ